MASKHPAARTATVTTTLTETSTSASSEPPVTVLHVSKPKESSATGPRVKWDEGTVDNEHMNKKKSKRCCIYHKPRAFDESSDESGDDEHHGACSHDHKEEPAM
eukprot:m.73749 g.73749  ORF g.73749 m.73749 type:complete len:104 (-) comp50305_c0_seq4:975-1286(-)